ncbi:MAG: hypothetical protein ABSA66_13385 [Roseiarcus sp.]
MIENYKIKRGLFRLGRATVKELAAFACANESTVRNYLNSRADLCVQESVPTGGRGRPTAVWTLTPAGREILRRELSRLWEIQDPDLDEERAAALGRIKESMAQVAARIGDLEAAEPGDDVAATLERLRARTRAMMSAIAKLGRSGRDLGTEVLLLQSFEARLDGLEKNFRAVEVAAEAVQTSVSVSVTAWAQSLVDELSRQTAGVVRKEDLFVPALAQSGPILVLDGTSGGVEWTRFLDVARAANAPTMRVQVLDFDKPRLEPMLRNVASHCAEIAGVFTQVVFAFDSRRRDTRYIVNSFKRFDALRRRPPKEVEPAAFGPKGPTPAVYARVASQLFEVIATLAATRSGTGTAPVTDPAVSSGAWLIARAMHARSATADEPRLTSYWIDAAKPSVVHEGGRSGAARAFDRYSIRPVPILSDLEVADAARSAFAWTRDAFGATPPGAAVAVAPEPGVAALLPAPKPAAGRPRPRAAGSSD